MKLIWECNNINVVTHQKIENKCVAIDEFNNLIELENNQSNKSSNNLYLLPGFIDSHTHGGYGLCFEKIDSYEYLEQYANNIVKEGVVGSIATIVSLSIENLNNLIDFISFNENKFKTKQILGYFFEGPFLSKIRKGAHDPNNIIPFNEDIIKNIINKINSPKVVALAVEENDNTWTKYKDVVNFSLGHSNANYQQAEFALNNGFKKVIHLYNAMSGFTHREPGIVNCILDNNFNEDVCVEIITDGIHVDNRVLSFSYKNINKDNLCVVSDCLYCKGLDNGNYKLGTLDIQKKDEICYLKDKDTIAGSSMPYNKVLLNFKKSTNCTWPEIVKFSSYNVARNLKLENKWGNILFNQLANFIIVDEELDVKLVYIDGKKIYEKK